LDEEEKTDNTRSRRALHGAHIKKGKSQTHNQTVIDFSVK
jgi:hypothetical protein